MYTHHTHKNMYETDTADTLRRVRL
jgi:hypothetical protein